MIPAYLILVTILVAANPYPQRKPWGLIAILTGLAIAAEVLT